MLSIQSISFMNGSCEILHDAPKDQNVPHLCSLMNREDASIRRLPDR